ncbi:MULTISPECIES: hypothetical protein [Streptomyces]|uniref:Integral membrane protein n=1 Tax=Streptomyces solicathayae TaxID=3081768 RepID=A0ABZ0LSZ0_9ACTN|nr:hypothetical protein [Streptomyces sp. HUAS YS2]WOX22614.1 hypothetical protein R2D22_14880 [Streptomyces sp. HUAS YS2]
MSQPVPPPGNPFADGAYPAAPQPAPVRDNVALGVLAALVAALVGGIVYGVVAGSIEREIGWAAIGVGFLAGFAASKVGGPNRILAVAAAVFSLGAVYLGQLVGIAVIGSEELNVPFAEMFFQHFDLLTQAWNESKDPMTFLFFVLAGVGAFGGARKAAQ